MKIDNDRGVILVASLFIVVVLIGLSSVFMIRAVNENRMAVRERDLAKAFYAGQGGHAMALKQMDTLINDYLLNTIASASPNGVITFANSKVNSGDAIGWLANAVRDNNTPVLGENGDQAEYSAGGTVGSEGYQYNIVITEKDDPVSVGLDAWDFSYSYAIDVATTGGVLGSKVKIDGDFTVRLQKDNFAKYALFTNEQETQGGTNVWFTDKTNFAGPVHTNNRFNFALNPSATFLEQITQHDPYARFYNNGSTVLLDADYNGNDDVPTFGNGFLRDQDTITFDASSEEQDMIDQATGGQTYVSNGIYITNDGSSVSGGIYVKGNGQIALGVDGSNNPQYTITQGGSTKTITLDLTAMQTTVMDNGSGTTNTYAGLPDGVDDDGVLIYVDGDIDSLGGVVQSDSTLTVASKNDVMITDNVTYQSYDPGSGTPGQLNYVGPSTTAANLLGLISWGGSVRIGTGAPDNLNIHGSVLASNGVFQVDDYNDTGVGSRGTATLLGGVISDNYGAFGLFNGSTGQQTAGYGRNFVYDGRMQVGQSPPYFPTLQTFVAFTNDLTDKLVWQEGE